MRRELSRVKWLIEWYGPDGQKRDALERWGKLRPEKWAKSRCQDGERYTITLIRPPVEELLRDLSLRLK